MSDVKEKRGGERFVVSESLPGSFGAAAITIVDISHHGVQVEHTQPLRLGTRGRLWFKRAEIAVSIQGMVIWSRLSKTPSRDGKLVYRTGIRLDGDPTEFTVALQALGDQGVVKRDRESMDRKRKQLQEKADLKTAKSTVKVARNEPDISPDQALLIQHARERLVAHPSEAQRWYDRARRAIVENDITITADVRGREDVLAVWEYLERSVALSVILRVIDKKS